MKYYLIAGERSGDLHGSNLMKQLMAQDNSADFRFFGGDYMKAVGGTCTVHYQELAFMGFIEVIRNLSTIRKYLKLCKEDIQAFSPDTIILIDYAGFNLRIAKWAKKKNIRVLYYISPKLWAWNSKRAYKIKKYVDHMFAIMPFEVSFYKKYGFNKVSYVGNPVVDAITNYNIDAEFLKNNKIETGTKKIIAVLPGSRKQELSYILPELIPVIKATPQHLYLVAAVNNLDRQLYAPIDALHNVILITSSTYDILSIADAALVTSGTATLETALWNVPQVVLYKGNSISMAIAKLVVNVKYISLVNLILNEPCVVELIQKECNSEQINAELQNIIDKPTDYSQLLKIMGGHNASEHAAIGIVNLLKLD